MQIHEVTSKKQTNEGLLDMAKAAGGAVKSGIGAYKDNRMDQRVSAMADKAYNAWSTYKKQIDKFYAQKGTPATPADYEKALLSFVQKNLLGGQQLSSVTTKDDIVSLVKQITGSTGTAAPPATTSAPATTTAPVDATTTAPAKIEAGKEVALGNEHYRWLGAQWALVNPKTGQPGKTAEKAIAPELTKMAQAGKFVTPYTSPDAGKLGADQAAANAAAGKKAGPYGFDTATGKPLPKPTKAKTLGTVSSAPGGATTTAPATPAEEPIIFGGRKLDPRNPDHAKTIATLKASGQLQEAVDPAEKKLFMQLVRAAALASGTVDPNAPAQPAQGATQTMSGKEAKSTGNPEADKILAQQGFTVK